MNGGVHSLQTQHLWIGGYTQQSFLDSQTLAESQLSPTTKRRIVSKRAVEKTSNHLIDIQKGEEVDTADASPINREHFVRDDEACDKLFCRCAFCSKERTMVYPDTRISQHNWYTAKDMTDREKLLAEGLNDPEQRDFYYILNCLRNPGDPRYQIHLLILDTLLLAHGDGALYVSSQTKGESVGALNFDTSGGIKYTNLRKNFLTANSEYNPFPLNHKKNRHFKGTLSTAQQKKAEAGSLMLEGASEKMLPEQSKI